MKMLNKKHVLRILIFWHLTFSTVKVIKIYTEFITMNETNGKIVYFCKSPIVNCSDEHYRQYKKTNFDGNATVWKNICRGTQYGSPDAG